MNTFQVSLPTACIEILYSYKLHTLLAKSLEYMIFLTIKNRYLMVTKAAFISLKNTVKTGKIRSVSVDSCVLCFYDTMPF